MDAVSLQTEADMFIYIHKQTPSKIKQLYASLLYDHFMVLLLSEKLPGGNNTSRTTLTVQSLLAY